MEMPYYKISKVAEMLKCSEDDIIGWGAEGKLPINFLTSHFKVFGEEQVLNDDSDELNPWENEEKFIVSCDEDHILDDDYLQLSIVSLKKLYSGGKDAIALADTVENGRNRFLHFTVKNSAYKEPTFQECQLVILNEDLKYFQELINEDSYIDNAVEETQVDAEEITADVSNDIVSDDQVDVEVMALDDTNDIVSDDQISAEETTTDVSNDIVPAVPNNVDVVDLDDTNIVLSAQDDVDAVNHDVVDVEVLPIDDANDFVSDDQSNIDTTELNVVYGDSVLKEPEQARKKLIPMVRSSSEGLELIHAMLEFYKVTYLDEMTAHIAWGRLVSKEFKHELVKEVSAAFIVLNSTTKFKKDDFLEKYRKRFK